MDKLPEFLFVKNIKGPINTRLRKLKQYNKVLSFLYYNKKSSVTNIVKTVELSQPLVSALLDELINFGIVKDIGVGESIGGRRPNLFEIVANYQYVVGLEINMRSVTISIFNLNNDLLFKDEKKDFELCKSDSYIDQLVDFINIFILKSNIDRSVLLALGISLPGLVNASLGASYTHLNFTEKNLANHLSEILNIPVLIDNDARTMALGEKHFGKAIGLKNVLCLNLSYGIGLGIIINGDLFAGKNGYAGEFGHILLNPKGELCHCGKIGCLETVCSGDVLIRNIKKAIDKGQVSLLADKIKKGQKINLKAIVEALKQGDQFCIEQMRIMGENLGMGLVSLIHLLNPEMIILGGKLSGAKQYIIDPVNIALNKYAMDRIRKETQLLTSDLNDQAALLGTMANVMNILLKEN